MNGPLDFGEHISSLASARGMTLTELAEVTNIDIELLLDAIPDGLLPTTEELASMAEALDIDIDELKFASLASMPVLHIRFFEPIRSSDELRRATVGLYDTIQSVLEDGIRKGKIPPRDQLKSHALKNGKPALRLIK